MIDEMRQIWKGMVLKIEFEKVYDYVDWDFLWFVLSKMGFGER